MNTKFHSILVLFVSVLLIVSFNSCSQQNTENDKNTSNSENTSTNPSRQEGESESAYVEPTNSNYRNGSICTIESGNGGFGIIKVLAIDRGSVHIKIYQNKYTTRPDSVDLSSLGMGSIDDPAGFGIGHVPLVQEGFDKWKPKEVGFEEVAEEELTGYKMWRNQNR